MEKFKDTVRNKTRRTQGKSIQEVIASLQSVMRGWYQYFKHSHWTTFKPLDGWVRMRLRSIQRKHSGRKGRGRGKDHFRWTNHYFDQRGYFSLEKAHRLDMQSR